MNGCLSEAVTAQDRGFATSLLKIAPKPGVESNEQVAKQ